MPAKEKIVGWVCVFLGLVPLGFFLLLAVWASTLASDPGSGGWRFSATWPEGLLLWSIFFAMLIPWNWLVRWRKTGNWFRQDPED